MLTISWAAEFIACPPVLADIISPDYMRAFIEASAMGRSRSPTRQAVETELNKFVPLEEIATKGVLKSQYDCPAELRIECYDAIERARSKAPGETVIPEWGEWGDNLDEAGQQEMVRELFDQAVTRGFNLLTNEELGSARRPPP